MDAEIVSRLASSVKVTADTLRLSPLTVPTLILRWPDWQMTSLFARGFRVAGMIEPSNVYVLITSVQTSPSQGSVHLLLDPKEADDWNLKVAGSLRGTELDTSVWQTAQTQSLATM